MESPTPSVSISAAANDGEVNKVPHELLDSRLVPVSTNKTLPVWKYFAMVMDRPITHNQIHANNIRTFIKSDNNAVIKRVHVLVAWLVINCKAPLSFATDVDLNEVIQAASYLKPRSYVPMMPGKIDHALISMFSKFTMCVNTLIVKAHAMYMLVDYDELANEYVGSNYG
ncbi:unnamed protein product [Sphagnum balticum]